MQKCLRRSLFSSLFFVSTAVHSQEAEKPDSLLRLLDSNALDQVFFIEAEDSFLRFLPLHLVAIGLRENGDFYSIRWDGKTYYLQWKDTAIEILPSDFIEGEYEAFSKMTLEMAEEIGQFSIPPASLENGPVDRARFVLKNRLVIQREVLEARLPYQFLNSGDLIDSEGRRVLSLSVRDRLHHKKIDPILSVLQTRAELRCVDEPRLPRIGNYQVQIRKLAKLPLRGNISINLYQDTRFDLYDPFSNYYLGLGEEEIFKIDLEEISEESREAFLRFLQELQEAGGDMSKTSFSFDENGSLKSLDEQVVIKADPEVLELIVRAPNLKERSTALPAYYNKSLNQLEEVRKALLIHLQRFVEEHKAYDFVMYYDFDGGDEGWFVSDPITDEFTQASMNRIRFFYRVIEE